MPQAPINSDEHSVTPSPQPTGEGLGSALRLSRSPQPYYRRKERPLFDSTGSHLPSPAFTPLTSDSERNASTCQNGAARRHFTRSSSDSGTEADDEALVFVKALPASLIQPRKGLRHERQSDSNGRLSESSGSSAPWGDYPNNASQTQSKPGTTHRQHLHASMEEHKIRNQDLLRRGLECLSLASIGGLLVRSSSILTKDHTRYKAELFTCTGLVVLLSVLFVARHLIHGLLLKHSALSSVFRSPTSYDPAIFIYPTFIPVLVSLALFSSRPEVLLPNTILSLSSLPGATIPTFGFSTGNKHVHWVFTLLPLWTSRYLWRDSLPILEMSKTEELTLLYPLHNTLSQLLRYTTTTSLLPSELHLLSTSLINILLCSISPQANILRSILWYGGVGLFVLCTSAIRWNITLERIPTWRLRNGIEIKRSDNISNKTSSTHANRSRVDTTLNDSGSEGDEPIIHSQRLNVYDIPILGQLTSALPFDLKRRLSLPGAVDARMNSRVNGSTSGDGTSLNPLRRSYTLPTKSEASHMTKRKQRTSKSSQPYLSMTLTQLEVRKWSYAAYVFGIVISLVLFVVRPVIARTALDGYDPFGWAIGYLFGDIKQVRSFVYAESLEDWAVLSDDTHEAVFSLAHTGWVERLRRQTIGAANTRLLLFTYWLLVVSAGVAIVLRLSMFAEVDTRRKVFHGMMVIMLLPTTFIDPAFLSLGLILVLAVFLLLDLFRAAQLRPISKPLAMFLTPYVDGRDLQGPVVVSHIFLLIGCAIPLWLSLAGTDYSGADPWRGWEVVTRDVSMIAGVVCVGMGDAAASLVGRRIGRHKWPWPGGKSLEGSAAFAVAVVAGLMLGKAWLRFGGWTPTAGLDNDDDGGSWLMILAKAGLAACGASFTEAVLTGCNDNVVVPVVLWLLVKGLQF